MRAFLLIFLEDASCWSDIAFGGRRYMTTFGKICLPAVSHLHKSPFPFALLSEIYANDSTAASTSNGCLTRTPQSQPKIQSVFDLKKSLELQVSKIQVNKISIYVPFAKLYFV